MRQDAPPRSRLSPVNPARAIRAGPGSRGPANGPLRTATKPGFVGQPGRGSWVSCATKDVTAHRRAQRCCGGCR